MFGVGNGFEHWKHFVFLREINGARVFVGLSFVSKERGAVLDTSGHEIGVHDGALFYTLGQRHGFTVSASNGSPVYVLSKDLKMNTITVGPEPLRNTGSPHFALEKTNWNAKTPQANTLYLARNRYRQELFPCTITTLRDAAQITFTEAPALTPAGQSTVVYSRESGGLCCLGGGIIS